MKFYIVDCFAETKYQGNQDSEMGRPSKLHIRAKLEEDNYTIQVGSGAYIVAEGEWR